MRGCSNGLRRAGRRQVKAALLVLALLLAVMIPVTTAPALTPRSVPQQNSAPNSIREGSSPPSDYWARTYGGSDYDSARSVQQTSDGGYIVAGVTESFGAGDVDFWVLKLDSSGSVTWQKTYGGSGSDGGFSVQQTADGGYIVVGYTNPLRDMGYDNVWVLKLNSTGGVNWQKAYGDSGNEIGWSVQQTSDGGYIVAGSINSLGIDHSDASVLKLNSSGSVTWQKAYGGSGGDVANSVQQTSDGGYIVAGSTNSFGAGGDDFWVLKLNSTGGVDWQRTCGGNRHDSARSVQQTFDGGYVIAGDTYSFGAGNTDFWVLKLDSSGSVTWQKTYGGSGWDGANSIQQTSDGGYVVAGETTSFGEGYYDDFWVLRLDSAGSVMWQKTYGGSNVNYAYSVEQTSDGGYILAGEATLLGAGFYDAWVVKLRAGGDIVWDAGSGASTQTTSAIPSDSSAVVSTTSVTPADSALTAQDTQATTLDSNAEVTVQSGGGGLTAQEILVILIVSLVVVLVVAVALADIVLAKKKRKISAKII